MKDFFSIKVNIYVEDTDFGGIVYHANYLKYMERARSERLKHHGLSLAELEKQDCFFALTHIDIQYLKPAKIEDTLEVTTEIENITHTTITLKQEIRKPDDPKYLYTNSKVTLVCINKQHKLIRIPNHIKEKF